MLWKSISCQQINLLKHFVLEYFSNITANTFKRLDIFVTIAIIVVVLARISVWLDLMNITENEYTREYPKEMLLLNTHPLNKF